MIGMEKIPMTFENVSSEQILEKGELELENESVPSHEEIRKQERDERKTAEKFNFLFGGMLGMFFLCFNSSTFFFLSSCKH